ncbi:Thioesterase/thiol ester dehydrase-isomerase [Rhypophila decipiens]|uniref:Thioesterase/thiol ester dehydrase-isomerase n=1 Tax=Rhypophila decipiens TaxID=261697 RepID=A0AAN6Y8Z2_9PEZI|nr:Thioesterase/thiol ester dehydrase-isomerase [Rhypophila decipiens]
METTTRSTSVAPAVKPHQAPADAHNQFVKDPVAHFRAIPWCATLLNDPAILNIIVVDRRPLPSGESNFVRRTMNSGTTVRATTTFLRMVQPPLGKKTGESETISRSTELLKGGGPADGEDPRNPFLLFNALLDLGEDLCGFAGTMQGGLFAVLMDEVMGTAANFQAKLGAYTVQFNTKFLRPVKLPQVVLVRGRVIKLDGRKIHVRGTIEDKDGNLMAEGAGLWVQMGRDVGRSQL